MIALLVLLAAAPSCTIDRAAALALSPSEFDQGANGWRQLETKPACGEAAADLIAAYRDAHWGTLTPSELHANFWHEGQLRAVAGQNVRAASLLAAGVNTKAGPDALEYALGTVAFLLRDKAALVAARTRLAKLPPPPDFVAQAAEVKAKYNVVVTWPLNLDVLDGLITCFDKPYRDAYAPACRTGK